MRLLRATWPTSLDWANVSHFYFPGKERSHINPIYAGKGRHILLPSPKSLKMAQIPIVLGQEVLVTIPALWRRYQGITGSKQKILWFFILIKCLKSQMCEKSEFVVWIVYKKALEKCVKTTYTTLLDQKKIVFQKLKVITKENYL